MSLLLTLAQVELPIEYRVLSMGVGITGTVFVLGIILRYQRTSVRDLMADRDYDQTIIERMRLDQIVMLDRVSSAESKAFQAELRAGEAMSRAFKAEAAVVDCESRSKHMEDQIADLQRQMNGGRK